MNHDMHHHGSTSRVVWCLSYLLEWGELRVAVLHFPTMSNMSGDLAEYDIYPDEKTNTGIPVDSYLPLKTHDHSIEEYL